MLCGRIPNRVASHGDNILFWRFSSVGICLNGETPGGEEDGGDMLMPPGDAG